MTTKYYETDIQEGQKLLSVGICNLINYLNKLDDFKQVKVSDIHYNLILDCLDNLDISYTINCDPLIAYSYIIETDKLVITGGTNTGEYTFTNREVKME